jgi:hypothetical protein
MATTINRCEPLVEESLIPKSGFRFSLGTNAKRLPGDPEIRL